MSTSAHSYDEADDDNRSAKRVRMPRRASGQKVKTRASTSGITQRTMLAIAFWGALLGGLLTCISLYRHGHAPSWRAIAMIAAHTLPLFMGLWLVQNMARWAESIAQSFAIGIGVMLLLTLTIMIILPSLALYVSTHAGPVSDELETADTLLDGVLGFAAMGYLYLATGFRYWWPFGILLPLYMGFWHWHSRRR